MHRHSTTDEHSKSSKKKKRNRQSSQTREAGNDSEDYRSCTRASCVGIRPVCFARASAKCCISGRTSRWYHVTACEHYCNACFELYYRDRPRGSADLAEGTTKDDYESFRLNWLQVTTNEPNVKDYMLNDLLPYWAQCSMCNKWREIPRDELVTSPYLSGFTCYRLHKTEEACDEDEDPRVKTAKESTFISSIPGANSIYLQSSCAAPLLTKYKPQTVGLSPSAFKHSSSFSNDLDTRYFQPFYEPGEKGKALCMYPNIVADNELAEFPEFNHQKAFYLGIRNTLIAHFFVSHSHPERLTQSDWWLTPSNSQSLILCRGICRVRACAMLTAFVMYYTCKGLINYGLPPPGGSLCPLLTPDFNKSDVIIVGGGFAGLAAMRQLSNFGTKVTLLESSDRLGGRVYEEDGINYGVSFINGVINNPITLLAVQAGVELHDVPLDILIFASDGKVVSKETETRVESFFNVVVDTIISERVYSKKGALNERDFSLEEKLSTAIKHLEGKKLDTPLTEEESRLLSFLMGNLEFSLWSPLSQVSSNSWDLHEFYAQFAGSTEILPHGGFSTLVERLSEGFDDQIRLNCNVNTVNYSDDEVIVTTSSGDTFQAARCLLTVPLSVYHSEGIQFVPPLPKEKKRALKALGCGKLEKLTLEFETRFWIECFEKLTAVNPDDQKRALPKFFALVPSTDTERGMCHLFFDYSPPGSDRAILQSYIYGEALETLLSSKDFSLDFLVDLAMSKLQVMCGDSVKVPKPKKSHLTSWCNTPGIGMSSSFPAIGCLGQHYDQVTMDVEQKLLFAGEVSNRHFPQTLAGAYLSGLREAGRIAELSAFS